MEGVDEALARIAAHTSTIDSARAFTTVAIDQGEIVGWARTERWSGYDTLEAFVAEDYRLRGVASFAACGLYASVLHDEGGTVAVFAPKMLLVARRAGFWPVLFEKVDGKWVRA